MNNYRWQWLPIVLVAASMLLILTCVVSMRDALGNWQYGVYLGAVVVLAALIWFRRRVTPDEIVLETLKSEIAARENDLQQEQREFRDAQRQFEDQVNQHAVRLDKREQDLANKLIAYHEWAEFPQPVDLSSAALPDDKSIAELAQKDRRMIELLEEESKRLFENIRQNAYSVDGKFQPALLRDEAYELINRVARIYQPHVKQAVLETSIAQVMQAASRAVLHFLVVLDRLPLNVKDYNINSLYGYVQKAVKAYGAYKFASPYFPYLRSAYYLGRYAMGTNPVSLGAWWFANALGTKGAVALTTRLVNQHALAFLHDVIRVIGFEVAGIYAGGFRHRDANWIYGTELTELICRFPPTHASLSHALKEVGALQLRSEYDRVYLYRLLSEHRSADPDKYRSDVFLTPAERQAIAGRLEKFLATFVEAKSPERVASWQDEVEARLRLKLQLPGDQATPSLRQQAESALRSLAGFLLVVKLREPADLAEDLAHVKVFDAFDAQSKDEMLARLQSDPPPFFEQPDLDPSGKVSQQFRQDLVRLAAHVRPYGDEVDEAVLDCAAYLREDLESIRQGLDKEYVACIRRQFPESGLPKKIPANVARAVLNLLDATSEPRFIYGGVTVESPKLHPSRRNTLWLVGVGGRIVLLSIDVTPRVLWRAEEAVVLKDDRSLLMSQCRIRGGQWLDGESRGEPVLAVAGPIIGGYDNYFSALKEFVASTRVVEQTGGSTGD